MEVYYAHITADGERKQTVKEHLDGTSDLAGQFAKKFGAEKFGELAGQAHDIGKYSKQFQQRLQGGPKVDHSSAGALECAIVNQMMVGMCVAGHHCGLQDYGNPRTDSPGDPTYIGRIKKIQPVRGTAYPGWTTPLPLIPNEPDFSKEPFYRSLWTRMIFSCLVDADFLDTEKFMNGGNLRVDCYDSMENLLKKLNAYVSKWSSPASELNKKRNKIRMDCLRAGNSEKGLFSLTVPTGGGKTISSLAFALQHAVRNKMDRIIYVVPYTSIIEQNAGVFREILGAQNVLEHHSEAVLPDKDDLSDTQLRLALATENWDAPIVVTTAVQFFESFYKNKSSKCRKLHNITNSIVIFDEAQMIPIAHLLPCAAVIGTLVEHFGVSAVLCTATQPSLSDILSQFAPSHTVKEICSDVSGLFQSLRRVTYQDLGTIDTEKLSAKIAEHEQALCIVNTRKSAQEFFQILPKEGRFHLSTLMYPRHRAQTLKEIRTRLEEGKPCRVVSTSLIEAGVDIDFPAVYRELSGVDSIVQSGGRCNREGKRPSEESIVSFFRLDQSAPSLIRINIGAAEEALALHPFPESPAAISHYFQSLRDFSPNLDKTDAVKSLCNGISGCLLPFQSVSDHFCLIEDQTKTVYIETEYNHDLIQKLVNRQADRTDYRNAGKFCVIIFDQHYTALLETGVICEISQGSAYLTNATQYNPETGLSLKTNTGEAIFE